MVSLGVRYLFSQLADDKIKIWTHRFPVIENPNIGKSIVWVSNRQPSFYPLRYGKLLLENNNNNNNNNDLEVADPRSGSSSTWFLVELASGNVCFWGEGKTGVLLCSGRFFPGRTNNKLRREYAAYSLRQPKEARVCVCSINKSNYEYIFFSFIVLVLVVCNHFKVKRKSLKLFIIKSF